MSDRNRFLTFVMSVNWPYVIVIGLFVLALLRYALGDET